MRKKRNTKEKKNLPQEKMVQFVCLFAVNFKFGKSRDEKNKIKLCINKKEKCV